MAKQFEKDVKSISMQQDNSQYNISGQKWGKKSN